METDILANDTSNIMETMAKFNQRNPKKISGHRNAKGIYNTLQSSPISRRLDPSNLKGLTANNTLGTHHESTRS
jgi:hypothetical protein